MFTYVNKRDDNKLHNDYTTIEYRNGVLSEVDHGENVRQSNGWLEEGKRNEWEKNSHVNRHCIINQRWKGENEKKRRKKEEV